ncbi:GlxA family transcriptional regulator [Microbacterium sp. ZW T5_56]|uniref:GlxA family transcriptional regulator n=1 Tax=Microbacterium sp. ZW T5_56 TaxID=3378081 RepID=UPI0038547AE3
MPSRSPHRVVVLAQDGAYPFEIGIPARVFGAADGAYEVSLVTPTGGPIRTNAGFDVVPTTDTRALAQADTVIVTPVDTSLLQRHADDDVRAALALVPRRARIVSICTGVFTLAAVGLLTGRTVTTHWQCAELFRDWYPHVSVDENVLFVDGGDILTSAGVASGIDLCLHLIRVDHGAELANRVARRCVVAPHRDGGQAQFIERPVPDVIEASTTRARAWALEHLDEPLTITQLARHALMSERTFTRRFRSETGLSPRQWLTRQRLSAARELLERTDLGMGDIAAAVGYATPTSLRNHLVSALGVSPTTYRRRFRTSVAVR